MRFERIAMVTFVLLAPSHVARAPDTARCSYIASYPSAVGKNTYMLGKATTGRTIADLDSVYRYGLRNVPAQLMQIEDVAGFQSDAVRRGLKASGGKAVFVRYGVSASCSPWPSADGSFDSAGVNGLYVGQVRAVDRWVDGRPTSDLFLAPHFPLPVRLKGPSGHLVISRVDSTPSMTAKELFSMYRALWTESVTVNDTGVGPRIKRWIKDNRKLARKQPANEVAYGMFNAVVEQNTAHTVPFGGAFLISLVIPGVDSMTAYARMRAKIRPWITEFVRDSATGLPIAITRQTFAFDLVLSATLDAVIDPLKVQLDPCSGIAVVVEKLPIILDVDSTWRGKMQPLSALSCAPVGSKLQAMSLPRATFAVADIETEVRFRRLADGRIVFDARAEREGRPSVIVRGESVVSAK